jgi:hypothetical protein
MNWLEQAEYLLIALSAVGTVAAAFTQHGIRHHAPGAGTIPQCHQQEAAKAERDRQPPESGKLE